MEEESICCGAPRMWGDLCSECKEHTDFVEVDNTPSEDFNRRTKECLDNFKKQDHG